MQNTYRFVVHAHMYVDIVGYYICGHLDLLTSRDLNRGVKQMAYTDMQEFVGE